MAAASGLNDGLGLIAKELFEVLRNSDKSHSNHDCNTTGKGTATSKNVEEAHTNSKDSKIR